MVQQLELGAWTLTATNIVLPPSSATFTINVAHGLAGTFHIVLTNAGGSDDEEDAFVISTIGVATGTLRGLQYIFQHPKSDSAQPDPTSPLTIMLLIGALVLTLIVGLFPDLIAPAIRRRVSQAEARAP
mgnify:CR=1 FL=1